MPSASSLIPNFTGFDLDGERIRMYEVLGAGSFGKVYRAWDRQQDMDIAVKAMLTPNPGSRQENMLLTELTLHEAVCPHPNIIQMHDAFGNEEYTFVVLQLCRDGDLFKHAPRFRYRNDLIRRVMLKIVDGLEHCHGSGVYHRDLKPENILCSEDGHQVYLADFGLATESKVSRSFRVGTVNYMSPECLHEDVVAANYHPELSDLWSLGIIFVNLLTGSLPWHRASSVDEGYRKFLSDPDSIGKLTEMALSAPCVELIKGLLAQDPMGRLTLDGFRKGLQDTASFYVASLDIGPPGLPAPRNLNAHGHLKARHNLKAIARPPVAQGVVDMGSPVVQYIPIVQVAPKDAPLVDKSPVIQSPIVPPSPGGSDETDSDSEYDEVALVRSPLVAQICSPRVAVLLSPKIMEGDTGMFVWDEEVRFSEFV